MSSSPERPVALAVLGEIEVDQRDALALRIAPDVDLAPVQQRVHPDVGLGREARHVLVPELGRLVLEVPAIVLAARAEVALLGARALLVAPDAGDQALEAVLGKRRVQAGGLARRRARRRRQGLVHLLDRRAGLDQQLEVPLLAEALAKRIHLLELLAGVDVHDRERHVAEERLAGEPEHDVAVLAERPQDRDPVELGERLAQDVDALGLEAVQVVHAPAFLCSGVASDSRLSRLTGCSDVQAHDSRVPATTACPAAVGAGRRAEHSDDHAALQEAPSRGDWSRRPCPLRRPSGIDAMPGALLTARSAPLAGPGG